MLKYLVFKYNTQEIPLARAFAVEHDFEFGAYMGAIPCPESWGRFLHDRAYRSAASEFLAHGPVTPRPVQSCPQESTIALNHRGELVQCCMSRHAKPGVSLLDADVYEYLNHRTDNDFCAWCLSSGFCHYTHHDRMVPSLLSECACGDCRA